MKFSPVSMKRSMSASLISGPNGFCVASGPLCSGSFFGDAVPAFLSCMMASASSCAAAAFISPMRFLFFFSGAVPASGVSSAVGVSSVASVSSAAGVSSVADVSPATDESAASPSGVTLASPSGLAIPSSAFSSPSASTFLRRVYFLFGFASVSSGLAALREAFFFFASSFPRCDAASDSASRMLYIKSVVSDCISTPSPSARVLSSSTVMFSNSSFVCIVICCIK